MKIYRLTIMAYDFWYTQDRDGFQKIEKFYDTREKAEQWMKEHPKYIANGRTNQTEAEKDYEMPKFKIDEIIVE